MPMYKLFIIRTLQLDNWLDELYYSDMTTKEQKIAWLEDGSLVIASNDSLFGQYSTLN